MNIEFQGDVSLVVMGEPRVHRFKISVVAEDVMVLWLEDCSSMVRVFVRVDQIHIILLRFKRVDDRVLERQTRELEKTDFVTEENAIPMAKLSDYAKRFAECLGGKGGNDIVVEWVVECDNAPTLKLVLPLQWSSYVATVHYLFRMQQVDLKPVDLVAARLSDVEETQQELKRSFDTLVQDSDGDGLSLLDQVRELKRSMEHVLREYSATNKGVSKTNETLMWIPSSGYSNDRPRPLEFRANGSILLREDSTYAVVAVFYTKSKATPTAPTVVSSMNFILEAKKGDTL